MNDVFFTIIRYGIAMAIGAVLGSLFSAGRINVRGRSVPIPYVARTSRNFTVVVILLLFGTGVAIVNQGIQANRQARCNEQFQTSITERSKLTTQDTRLGREQEELSQSDRDALRSLVSVLTKGDQTNPGTVQSALTTFDRTISMNADKRADLNAERDQIVTERASNPIPEPNCVSENSNEY